jgi:8-oxo-dGTP pyrophosphatase MutT (NUDIX family)
VVAILRLDGPEIETLLIQRSERPDDPGSGQVALPGGRRDPADRSLTETALRELGEEVGLGPTDLLDPPRFFGVYPASAFGVDVAVFVSRFARGERAPRAADPREVDSVFWLPRGALDRTEPVVRATRVGPLEVEATRHDGHVLWGFTLRVLKELFGTIEGRPLPTGPAPQRPTMV